MKLINKLKQFSPNTDIHIETPEHWHRGCVKDLLLLIPEKEMQEEVVTSYFMGVVEGIRCYEIKTYKEPWSRKKRNHKKIQC